MWDFLFGALVMMIGVVIGAVIGQNKSSAGVATIQDLREFKETADTGNKVWQVFEELGLDRKEISDALISFQKAGVLFVEKV